MKTQEPQTEAYYVNMVRGLKTRLKVHCATINRPMTEILSEIVREYLDKNKA